jgi:SAM-dependent methyltransferase
MKNLLLNFIVCPSCGVPLHLNQGKVKSENEITSGELRCENGHSFPILESVPRLINTDDVTGVKEEVQSSFSEKWSRIPNYGHDEKTREFQLQWYLQRYGWNGTGGLYDFLATRKLVLDAGTGTGRDTKLYAEHTPGQVFGIDISRSVEAAHQHLRHLPNAHLIQADLTHLPFPKKFFDFIASDQVLHHTPNTEASFKYLVEHLAPGGQIAIYVYKKKGPVREFCDDYLRSYTTKLNAEECYQFSKAITSFGKSLSDQKVEITVPEDIPLLAINAGKHNLQRFIYWNFFKCFWNDDFDFETNVMVNFDWYHPKDAHRHTPEEVKRWFQDMNLEMVHFDVNESGISARGKK